MRLLALVLAMTAAAPALADCPATVSPAHRIALVELYTSEGCSSCPPADRWLSRLPPSQARYVPLAMHVSYWDYIGWKDRFADARFTERQRAMARIAGARSVYTPQVMVGGKDFRPWSHERGFTKAVEAVNGTPAGAKLSVRARVQAAPASGVVVSVDAELPPGVPPADLALFTLLTQHGLASRVTAGENRGELLRHDHVARDITVSGDWSNTGRLMGGGVFARGDASLDRLSAVAFVQNLRTGEILQALSAPVCRA